MLGFLQFYFFPFVLGPFLGKRLIARLAFQDAAQSADAGNGHRLKQNAFGRSLEHGLGAVLDLELLAQTQWDDDLALGRESDGIRSHIHTHRLKYD
jgi:hypothetical protein